MSGGTSPFAYTAPIGGSTSVTLPEISVGPDMPAPVAGGGGGALPGSGSYGDPISGFHQINQQAADFQKSFSAQTGAASNSANAAFQAQNTARAAQAQAQFNTNQANANAASSALFAGPTITGPVLPPNFAQTAQKPAPDLTLPPAEAQPRAEMPSTPPPAQTPYLQGLIGAAMDGRAASFVADRYRQGVEQRGGAPLPSLGSVLNGTAKTGEQGIEDLQAMARSIAESLDYFQKGVDGTISLNDPETGLPTDEAIRHSFNLATLGMTGGFGGVATRAGETVLGAGPVRVTAEALERRGLTVPKAELDGAPRGLRSTNEPGALPREKAGVDSENQVADGLAAQGYDVVQNPTVPETPGAAPPLTPERMEALGLSPSKDPDLLVNNRVFDTYTPVVDNAGSIRSGIAVKVEQKQTDRIMLDLRGTTQSDATIRAALRTNPVPGLKEVITLTDTGLGRAFP